jgi:RHS repeat-associated protein
VSAYTGAGTDFSYTIQNAGYNTSGTNYTYPSFPASPITGSLDGGSNGSSGSNPVTVYSFAGSYDGVSNLSSYTDSVMGTWNFSYDTLNRLVSSQNTAVSSATPQFAGNYGCWSYDAFGNRLSQSMSTTACGSSPPLMSWANYNANNQFAATSQALGGVPYDASGDVLNDGVNQYLYDGEGRICAVASTPVPGMTAMTGYLYDADGTRVAKGHITAWSCDPSVNGFQTTNDYILGPGGEQVTEMGVDATAGSSATTLAWQHTNVYAPGLGSSALIATYDNDGLHFYFNDPLGTRRAQTDYAGVIEQTCQSLPFGDGLSCSGGNLSAPTEHHFTGKERDTESGNDYFGARYYASSMGRFMSPDWSAKVEPVPYSKLDNPQTLNLYAYVGNNPLSGIDSDGHVGENVDFLASAGHAALALANSINSMATQSQLEQGVDLGSGFVMKTHQQATSNPKPVVNCFAQLKYRPTKKEDNVMNHSSWYVQGSDGVQHTLTGGPDTSAPGAPPSGFLNMWDKKPEDLSAPVSFDSKLSPANCKSVDAMIKAVHRFPNNTITYDWRGPNSNGTARYLGNVGGYSPAAPPLSTGWSTPIPGVE